MTPAAQAKWIMAAALSAACAATSACADLSRATAMAPSGVNIESPVAATVADASRRSYPYPRFKSLPLKPAPTQVRTPASFRTEVAEVSGRQAAVQTWRANNPPFAADGDLYADAQRKRFPTAVGADAPPADQADATEAWAAARRAAAQPPPPPK